MIDMPTDTDNMSTPAASMPREGPEKSLVLERPSVMKATQFSREIEMNKMQLRQGA